jgi:hypothetical protein
MKPSVNVPDNISFEPTTPDRILQIVLASWRQGNFAEVADRSSDQFTFIDHALGLEFNEKNRLIEFLVKIREYFPDSERKDSTIFSTEDLFISQWTLTATKAEPFLEGRSWKVPICVHGVSVVQIANLKINQWSDYYDQLKSRRYSVATWFTNWIEL